MPDYDRIRRIVEGTLPAEVEGPEPTEEQARQIARLAILKDF